MPDSGGDIFQSALSDFTFEAACGGAVRHLTDSGLTVKQIMEKLDYPISGERVRKEVYKHLCNIGVILEESPEKGLPGAKPEYVLEYNSYGRPSYRRKSASDAGENESVSDPETIVWKEIVYSPAALTLQGDSGDMPEKEYKVFHRGKGEKGFKNPGQDNPGTSAGAQRRGEGLSAFLAKKLSSKQEEPAYLSCDFGIPDSTAAKGLLLLNGRQREYLEGIPWPCRRVYHRLDHRMTEIVCSLYEQRAYEGICYFLSAREKVLISD